MKKYHFRLKSLLAWILISWICHVSTVITGFYNLSTKNLTLSVHKPIDEQLKLQLPATLDELKENHLFDHRAKDDSHQVGFCGVVLKDSKSSQGKLHVKTLFNSTMTSFPSFKDHIGFQTLLLLEKMKADLFCLVTLKPLCKSCNILIKKVLCYRKATFEVDEERGCNGKVVLPSQISQYYFSIRFKMLQHRMKSVAINNLFKEMGFPFNTEERLFVKSCIEAKKEDAPLKFLDKYKNLMSPKTLQEVLPYACSNGFRNIAKYIVEERKISVNYRCTIPYKGLTPAMITVAYNQKSIFDLLSKNSNLSDSFSFNIKYKNINMLCFACEKKRLWAVKYLVEKAAQKPKKKDIRDFLTKMKKNASKVLGKAIFSYLKKRI